MTLSTLPSSDADRDCLQQAAAGSDRAVGLLYDKFGALLYAVAYRVTRDATEAEEAVAEAFAQAWRTARTFEATRGSVAAWLTMMCRSRALDIVRARVRRERATESAIRATPDNAPGMGAASDDPSRLVEQSERQRVVQAAMVLLSDVQRQAIELAYFEGLSHSEISARLGEPLGTVKTRVRLGMQKLRDALRPLMMDASA